MEKIELYKIQRDCLKKLYERLFEFQIANPSRFSYEYLHSVDFAMSYISGNIDGLNMLIDVEIDMIDKPGIEQEILKQCLD